jgi:hypothetical protein
MGKKSINMNGPILILVSLIGLFFMTHYYKNKRIVQNKLFEEKGLFTIGKVVEYGARTYGPYGGSSAFIKFVYNIYAIEFKTESDYNVPENNGPKKGEQFMAIYLPDKPDECALLLDYPVKDSADYKRYIEEFKKNPQPLNKRICK